MAELTYLQVDEILKADFEAGKLFWKPRGVHLFQATENRSAEHAMNLWNARYDGAEAFTHVSVKGYKIGSIFGKNYFAHRVLWLLYTGAWPAVELDHMDRVKTNNQIGNLREATSSENSKNRSLRSDNLSGHTGVTWNKDRQKWCVQISIQGKNKHIGLYLDLHEAVAVRKHIAAENGYLA